MAYGGGGANVGKVRCEGCREFILQHLMKVLYGPDEMTWFDDTRRKRAHHFCPPCYEKERRKHDST